VKLNLSILGCGVLLKKQKQKKQVWWWKCNAQPGCDNRQ